uniref:Beta-microseminoprotein n=1 Tax=Felis catus TaxID=9685 RepID=A0ABI7WTR6_FELCA
MRFLASCLRALANFVTLCNAQCCVIPNKNTPGGLSNGKSWLLNVYYIIAAWFCFCGPGVGVRVGMCNTASGGADATPQCQKIFNKEICSYKVVEQNDPERTCIVL